VRVASKSNAVVEFKPDLAFHLSLPCHNAPELLDHPARQAPAAALQNPQATLRMGFRA
jgi:hypothetical protein